MRTSRAWVALLLALLALLTGALLLASQRGLPQAVRDTHTKPKNTGLRPEGQPTENADTDDDENGVGNTRTKPINTDFHPDGWPTENADPTAGAAGPMDEKDRAKDSKKEDKTGNKKGAPGEKRKDGGMKGRGRGRGIGPEVSQLATHGVHGKPLEEAVKGLQAAHGIGKTNPTATAKDKEKGKEEAMKKREDEKDKTEHRSKK